MAKAVFVRRIEQAEASVARQLRLSALSESPKAFGGTYEDALSRTQRDYEIFASSRATSDINALFIAIDSNEPVGMIGAFFDNATSLPFISSMWVSPACRRTGVGKWLFLAAKEWLQGRGAQEVNAWVVTENSQAISFYETLGFVATEVCEPLPSDSSLVERLYIYSVLVI